ncbi:hypothetical protein DSAG12_00366 [Promethearchaeum syntrophicum]|uniref:Uncharacterized protein n=1 Tax=Promethearchaeum syntrophicum TaxID=2594042 RepID=A0A5B9D6D0_9ARCH|nr:hypothetical protein [Candidatus Prometheoarchaeum syntrophicum]QEE14553.1 hypothetical protein DSAG12_00366 [Candidatus Prometheoarchaeum syntrophicum]
MQDNQNKQDNLSNEEKFILKTIKESGENGKSISYKNLQDLCADEFEGVRLILKKLKGKNLVDFDGIIPGFSSVIILVS